MSPGVATAADVGANAAPFRVETPAFEGPIDLLVHLVGSHDVEVLDIPLAPMIDAFVAAVVDQPQDYPLDTRSHFLVTAATLCHIKSQRLLPKSEEVEDEEDSPQLELRDLLLSRRLEGLAYVEIAQHVMPELMEQAARSRPREVGLDDGFVPQSPSLLDGVSPARIAEAYLQATTAHPPARVDLSHVAVETITVSETVQSLAHSLPARGSATLRELTGHLHEPVEVIVHFLAVLELCKLGKVDVSQAKQFGDVKISWVAATSSGVDDLVVAEYEG